MKVFICCKEKSNHTKTFPLDKLIDMFKHKYEFIMVKGYDGSRPDLPRIEKRDLLKIKEKCVIIFTEIWDVFSVPSNIYSICLSYYSPSVACKSIDEQHQILIRNHKINAYCVNFTHKSYHPHVNEKCIGDIHIDNCLHMSNLPTYDIVYFPNFIGIQTDKLRNLNYEIEFNVVYNVLQRYKDKYSVITLPHPHHASLYSTHGAKFVNPHFGLRNIDFIPNAKVIINSCKSFIGVSMVFNKPLIHLQESLTTTDATYLPIIEEFVKEGSYLITHLTEQSLEEALDHALNNDIKREVRTAIHEKYAKEIYSPDEESPTERLEKIISSV